MPRPNLPAFSQLAFAQVGERFDLTVRQGSTLGPFKHIMRQPDDVTPVDLTGCTILATVRKSPREPGEPLATFQIAYPSDRTLGYYHFGIPDEITGTMPMTSDEESFYWDSELIDSLGRVIPLYYGTFRVVAEATREDIAAIVVGC